MLISFMTVYPRNGKTISCTKETCRLPNMPLLTNIDGIEEFSKALISIRFKHGLPEDVMKASV